MGIELTVVFIAGDIREVKRTQTRAEARDDRSQSRTRGLQESPQVDINLLYYKHGN